MTHVAFNFTSALLLATSPVSLETVTKVTYLLAVHCVRQLHPPLEWRLLSTARFGSCALPFSSWGWRVTCVWTCSRQQGLKACSDITSAFLRCVCQSAFHLGNALLNSCFALLYIFWVFGFLFLLLVLFPVFLFMYHLKDFLRTEIGNACFVPGLL